MANSQQPWAELPTIHTAGWEAVRELHLQREKVYWRSVTPRESKIQFDQLMEFTERFSQTGRIEKLRQFELDQLIRWKRKLDSLSKTVRG